MTTMTPLAPRWQRNTIAFVIGFALPALAVLTHPAVFVLVGGAALLQWIRLHQRHAKAASVQRARLFSLTANDRR